MEKTKQPKQDAIYASKMTNSQIDDIGRSIREKKFRLNPKALNRINEIVKQILDNSPIAESKFTPEVEEFCKLIGVGKAAMISKTAWLFVLDAQSNMKKYRLPLRDYMIMPGCKELTIQVDDKFTDIKTRTYYVSERLFDFNDLELIKELHGLAVELSDYEVEFVKGLRSIDNLLRSNRNANKVADLMPELQEFLPLKDGYVHHSLVSVEELNNARAIFHPQQQQGEADAQA